jgi:predicted RNA binding protein YcfA (HicA-like mRNA interferase family)
MNQLDKLVEKFLRRPPEVLFEDVAKVLKAFGYEERPPRGGSHRFFAKPGRRGKTIPTVKGRYVKRRYVSMIIDNLGLEEWYERRHGA